MALILDGNPEISVHMRSNLCYLICLRHLIRSRAVTNRIFFFSEKSYFPSCVRVKFWVTIWYKNHGLGYWISRTLKLQIWINYLKLNLYKSPWLNRFKIDIPDLLTLVILGWLYGGAGGDGVICWAMSPCPAHYFFSI